MVPGARKSVTGAACVTAWSDETGEAPWGERMARTKLVAVGMDISRSGEGLGGEPKGFGDGSNVE